MENKKLGGGILTISIIYLVFLGFGLIGSIISLSTLDQINSVMAQMGGIQLTPTELIISIILSFILLFGIILISSLHIEVLPLPTNPSIPITILLIIKYLFYI